MLKVMKRFEDAVNAGIITKRSAGAYKANITRQHREIDLDRSLTTMEAAGQKAAVSRKIRVSAGI